MILCVCVLVDDPSERLGELQDLSEEWNSQNIKTTSWCATIALPYHQPYDSDTETPVRLLDPPCSRLWIVPRIIIQFLSNRRHWHGMKRHNELSTVSSVTSVLFMFEVWSLPCELVSCTPWTMKKHATMFLIITLAFLGRFLNILYQQKQEGIVYKKIIIFTTSP